MKLFKSLLRFSAVWHTFNANVTFTLYLLTQIKSFYYTDDNLMKIIIEI